jgi:hypothetical protein
MFTIEFDKRPLEQLENDLDKLGERALPYSVRDTLNTAAYKTSELAKKNARRIFTMRNQFTTRSIQFEKTFARRIDDMESAAGSLQEYMREQAEGFTRHKKGKHGVPIPTSAAAGQEGARPRTKVIRRTNWINKLRVARARRRARDRGQEIVLAVREAVETKQRVVFLRLRNPGLYRVLGGRKVKRGWPTGARLQMLYSLEKSSTRTRERDWLGPPSRLVGAKIGDYYREALIRQIERQRLFRNRGK